MTQYDYVEVPKPKESGFDLSYSNKLTMDFGDLVPVFKQEVLPSDEFKVKAQFMVRMAPLANPIFTKINAQIHYFFVPNRLLWNESKNNCWETFITGGKDGTATPTPPYFNLKTIFAFNGVHTNPDNGNDRGVQTLPDYLGIPLTPKGFKTSDDYDYKINALPFLAYQKIYDDWFRDCNVTTSLFDRYEDEWLAGGAITTPYEALKLRRRSWSKDYFTSALPWAQRGQDVSIPMPKGLTSSGIISGTMTTSSNNATINGAIQAGSAVDPNQGINWTNPSTIRDLRNASALQLFLEKNAIGGARYIEQLLAHFGVYSDDARLQRAEYLGSVKSPVVISEVQSNAETEDAPLGKLGGKGISYGNDFAFDKKFTEHGWIIGVMSIMPEATYAQGLHRSLYKREDKLDYAFPEFSEIGLQQIDKCELYIAPTSEQSKDEAFGYNDRFGEYKSNYNEVHGFFKDDTNPMAQYNMTRFYSTSPELGSDFLEVNESKITSPFVDTERNVGNLWVDLYNDVKAIRPLPKNSLPLF